MINLVFIVAFALCLGITVAAILISHQFITTYNQNIHKNYFYYLVAFYAFAIYGIWGQILFHVLLDSMQTERVLIEAVANIVPVLGIPFLIISWIMLIRMGYSLAGKKMLSFFSYLHVFVFLIFGIVIWYLYENLDQDNMVFGVELTSIQIGILFFIDLFYILLFSIITVVQLRNNEKDQNYYLYRFVVLMLFGLLLRGIVMVLVPISEQILPLLIVLYFISNLIPVFYLSLKADLVFEPVKAENPSEEKIEKLFRKYKITKREREIVGQICQGKTNQQIADELFISLQTVKDHTHRIYSKIGINNRMKLVQMVNA